MSTDSAMLSDDDNAMRSTSNGAGTSARKNGHNGSDNTSDNDSIPLVRDVWRSARGISR